MKKTGRDRYPKYKIAAALLTLPVLFACQGCSEDYVNLSNYVNPSDNSLLQNLSEEIQYLTGTESSLTGPDVSGNDPGRAEAESEICSDTVSAMGMTRSVRDVFVSAGSGDITQISSDELASLGVKLENSAEEETDEEDAAAHEEMIQRRRDTDLFRESKYAYGQLGDHERKVYVEIYRAIQGRIPEVKLSSLDVDEIDTCFNCVMIDNPDFFYTDGYKMTRTLVNGELESISFSPRYTMTGKEILEKEDYIDSYVNKFITGMPDLPNEYSKAKYIFDYLVENTEYDIETENNQNICSVFVDNKSVCQGYAMAAKYLADELGIFCTIVYGEAGGENHAWNLMRLDGTYCHVDITWGDTSYKNSSEGTDTAMTDYVYMGASDDLIAENHIVDTVVRIPVCDSLDSYYFVREGRYFTEDDHEKLHEVFDRAYEDNEETLTIRCADKDVYDEMDDYLFDDGRVFRYLKGTGKARYVRNRDELTITFLLT
ncbi:MAG: hypothetical protein K6F86_02235 [Lachnospiraceae bacterium]|nr:hypothetical protein [Lachnospiraceae bacterium]